MVKTNQEIIDYLLAELNSIEKSTDCNPEQGSVIYSLTKTLYFMGIEVDQTDSGRWFIRYDR